MKGTLHGIVLVHESQKGSMLKSFTFDFQERTEDTVSTVFRKERVGNKMYPLLVINNDHKNSE